MLRVMTPVVVAALYVTSPTVGNLPAGYDENIVPVEWSRRCENGCKATAIVCHYSQPLSASCQVQLQSCLQQCSAPAVPRWRRHDQAPLRNGFPLSPKFKLAPG